jgi:hypothetical protein
MKLRVIDALQLPEVLDGSKWITLPVPVLGTGGRETTIDHDLLSMTIGVDPGRQQLHYCDGTYDARAAMPTHFGSSAALTLKRLLGECKLVDAKKGDCL